MYRIEILKASSHFKLVNLIDAWVKLGKYITIVSLNINKVSSSESRTGKWRAVVLYT